MKELYLKLGLRFGWIGLVATQGTITFTAWNGKARRFDNIKRFAFLPKK